LILPRTSHVFKSYRDILHKRLNSKESIHFGVERVSHITRGMLPDARRDSAAPRKRWNAALTSSSGVGRGSLTYRFVRL
jgi:hypothetical protein